jgi:tetratricopeptide (TPR) repeat protein
MRCPSSKPLLTLLIFMPRHTASFLLCLVALVYATADLCAARVNAQDKKPSQALRQVNEQQRRLLESFDKDVSAGRTQTHEWEARAESLRQFTAARAAEFKPNAWQDEELLALATLYQWAEQFPQAITALRAYLASNAKSRATLNARLSLGRALIETEQFDEAAKLLNERPTELAQNPVTFMTTVALYKDLATAMRDAGRLAEAAEQAQKGFDLVTVSVRDESLRERLRETAARDQFSLAALFRQRKTQSCKSSHRHASIGAEVRLQKSAVAAHVL